MECGDNYWKTESWWQYYRNLTALDNNGSVFF